MTTNTMTPEYLIEKLHLKPLEREGGYYKETYKSEKILKGKCLDARYSGSRNIASAIYYLLTPDTKSAIHRLKTDEIFHFYAGDPVLMLLIHPDKRVERKILGNRIDRGESPQIIVPANAWQGSLLMDGGKFALMGTTMAPGFDFDDYEDGKRQELINNYPEEKELIKRLTAPF